MQSIEDYLEEMENYIDSCKPVPLSGGKAVMNAEELRTMIEDIRLVLPQEIRKAQSIVTKRNDILADARKEAEDIVRKAEERARRIVDENEIAKEAAKLAAEREANALARSREIRKGATDYAEACLRRTEDYMSQRLAELRRARQSLRSTPKAGAAAQGQSDEEGGAESGEI